MSITRRTGSRFIVRVAATLALAPTGALACSKNPTAPDNDAVRAFAFGDSITAGVGTTTGNDFVTRLSNRTGLSIVTQDDQVIPPLRRFEQGALRLRQGGQTK